ncbi:(Fe-S)-binding protein [Metabacillus arenae]|uniref:Glycolate oxidase iron-sulfur subunit n=1 Tax=Metabacillus arenae TaxID=2771434 RepID=A0A926NG40_9BACI|nr:(Fe-S)-binding protein [Metabacillus arenae]MBD1380919.1 (Fe-S)-binding protein [Metabacillus arenae]
MKALTTEEAMHTCVRCGACREVCPTLDITGREADGPRGRVLMARSLIQGDIPVNKEIKDQLDRCLLCSACVDACPIDVPVPDIVMLAKSKIDETRENIKAEVKDIPKESLFIKRAKAFFFEKILPHQTRLHLLGHLLWIYQKSGLQRLVRKLGIMKLFPPQLADMERIMPEILSPGKRKTLPILTANSNGNVESPKSAAMFRGCIMDVMFRETNENSIKLLSKSGFHVHTPPEQTCCGALHMHNGKRQKAIELAKQNIEVFEQSNAETIVSNAGGCGAALREYEELFRDDPEWLPRAKKFSSKVRDISEVILEKGSLPQGVGEGERVTYQPSCHLQYVMKVKDAPTKLLKTLSDSTFVNLPDSKLCCGSAGIYNLLQPELANDILDKKMEQVNQMKPDVLITANPGCFLQMKSGIYKNKKEETIKPLHIVDYLMESINRAEQKNQ